MDSVRKKLLFVCMYTFLSFLSLVVHLRQEAAQTSLEPPSVTRGNRLWSWSGPLLPHPSLLLHPSPSHPHLLLTLRNRRTEKKETG